MSEEEIILNSDRAKFTSQILGPFQYFEQQQLDIYQKDGDLSDYLRHPPSEFSQQCNENKTTHYAQLKATFPTNKSKSFSRRKQPANIKEKRSESQSIKKQEENNSFMKNLFKNSLVEKFKNLLFQHSYVLPTKSKEILLTESYLTEDLTKKKIQNQNQQQQWLIFFPGDRRLIIWDQLSLLMNLLSLWVCPFLWGFHQFVLLHHGLEILIIFYLIFDIIICFNRAIIDQGELIQERKMISQYYIKQSFIRDLLSIILWVLCCFEIYNILFANEIIFFTQLALLLNKLKKNYQHYIEHIYIKGAVSHIMDIISLIVSIYFFAHFMACAWHYIGISTQHLGITWISRRNLLDENEFIRYNHSFYWATMTMVTVGYGDIVPENYLEMIFVNIVMLVSSFMYAYSLNSIGIILKSYNDQRQKYTYCLSIVSRQLIMMNSYMRKNLIDEPIQNRVRNYITYQMASEYNENSDNVYQVIKDLPMGLRSELSSDLQTKILMKIKILDQQFSKQTKKSLINQLKLSKLTPNDYCYHRGDTTDPSLYYVDEGEIQLLEENSKKVLTVIRKGETFGEYQFFTGQMPKCSAQSTEFTTLYVLKRADFLNQIRYYQQDFEKFHNIKDAILFNQSLATLLKSCSICKRISHISIECPLMTYQPNLEQRIKKSLFYTNQEREQEYCRQNQKQHVRLLYLEILSSIKYYQQQQDFKVNPIIETADGTSLKLESPDLQILRPLNTKKTTIQPILYKQAIEEVDDEKDNLQQQTSMHERLEKQKSKRKTTFVNTLIAQQNQQLRKSSQKYTILQKPVQTSLVIHQSVDPDLLDEFNIEPQFHCNDIDKLQNYSHYKTHNNADYVIRNFEYLRKTRNKHYFHKLDSTAHSYTFNQTVVNKISSFNRSFLKSQT